jgi:hypothetical protein
MAKERYSIWCRQVSLWEFCVGDVASEGLNIALVGREPLAATQSHGHMGPSGANIDYSGDMSIPAGMT